MVDGESINALSIEFGINESSIRRKIKPNKAELQGDAKPLHILASEKVQADKAVQRIAEQIAELPIARQQIVSDLARKLSNVSGHLASAAEYGAITAHRLSALANQHLDKVDDVNPASSADVLQTVAALTKMANASSEIPLNLLRANKEQIDEMNKDARSGSGRVTMNQDQFARLARGIIDEV